MDSITAALNHFFSTASGWGSYLLAVTGLGTLTMAIIQVVKDTTPLRRWFFRRAMGRWLSLHADIATQTVGKTVSPNCAEREMLVLAADGDCKAFYSLEIEKLCGQWSAAAQIVTEYPSLYESLFRCLAARAAKNDQAIVLSHDVPETLPPSVEAQLQPDHQVERTKRRQTFLEARTRVAHQIQRGIDSFQIETAFRWEWHLRIASFAISATIALAACLDSKSLSLGTALVSAAMAGFLAPVARDLLAAVQALRK